MKIWLALIFVVLIATQASAQTFEWSNGYGGGSSENGNSIVSDTKDNNYFTGVFNSETFVFGQDTFTSKPIIAGLAYANKLIIGKHSKTGNPIWGYSPTLKNNNGSCEGRDIKLKNSSLYVTGDFTDTVIFSNQDTLYSGGNSALFLMKMDTTGQVEWAVSNDTSGIARGYGITANDTSIIICGRKGKHHYLARYDTNGQLEKEKLSHTKFSSSASRLGKRINDVGIDDQGNIFGIGTFPDSIGFGSTRLTSDGKRDGFLFKFNQSFQIQWLNKIGSNNDFDEGNAIDVTNSGKFIATGSFKDHLLYLNDSIKGLSVNTNVFIGSFKSNGKVNWLNDGGSNTGSAGGNDVNLGNNFIYVTGFYGSSNKNIGIIFGKDTLQNFGGSGQDIFITKLDKNGRFLFAFGGGGGGITNEGNGLGNDAAGASYVTGRFKDTIQFGEKQVIGNGGRDIFVTKLSDIRIYQDTIPDTTLCAGQSLQVPFTVEGDFDLGNTFTAQLSNDTGNFDKPISIGSIRDTVGDTIQATIPDTLAYGKGYKMRIISDSPRVVSFDDWQTYTIYPQGQASLESASKVKTGKANGSVKFTLGTHPQKKFLAYARLYARHPDSNAFRLLADSIPLKDTTYTYKGVNTQTTGHAYYLALIDSCGFVSDSTKVHQTIDLSFQVGQLTHFLNWTPYQGWPVQNYLVQRKRADTFVTIDSLASSDTSTTKQPEPCNSPITYRIKAIDSNGVFSYSDTATREALDTINPNRAELENVSVIEDSLVKATFKGADSLDIYAYDVMRKRQDSNFQLIKQVIFDTPGGQFTVYDTTATRTEQLCYTLLTKDSCLNVVSSDTFCAVQLEGRPGNQRNYLSWHPFSGFSNLTYHIQRKNGNTWDQLATTTDTVFTDSTDMACHVPETYRIMTVSGNGLDTSYSDTLVLTPYDSIAPTVPQMRFASVDIKDHVNVHWAWETKSNQKYFELYRDQGNGNFQLLDTVIYDSTYTDTTANPTQTRHQYYVIPTDSCLATNRSTPSDTDRIMVPIVQTGACQPENRLSWNAYNDLPQGTDYYQIYRQQPATSNFQQLTTNNKQQTTYIDTNLNDTTTYCYRIQAVDTQSGYSSWTDSVCKEPFDYPVPDTTDVIRSTVTKTGTTNGEIEVKWRKYDESDTFARGYYVYHSDQSKNGPYQLIANIPDLADTTFVHKGLNTTADLNHYRILVYNLCKDEGGIRNIHRPVNLQVTNRNLQMDLNWYAYQGFPVNRYEVERSVNGGPFQSVQQVAGTDTAWVDTAIECGRSYAYQVLAYGDERPEISISDSVVRQGFDTVSPERPLFKRGSVKATGSQNGVVHTTWKPSSSPDVEQYLVYRSANGQNYRLVDSVRDTAYQDKELDTYSEDYYYKLKAIDSCRNVSDSFSTVHRTINLDAEGANEANILTWNRYEGRNVREYQILRGGQARYTVDGTTTRFRDEQVICDSFYDYQVKAVLAGGYESFSNRDSAKAYDTKPPEPVYLQRATLDRFNDVVELKWQAASEYDAAGYEIYRNLVERAGFQQVATIKDPEQTTYYDSFDVSNQEVCYEIRVLDACGNVSGFSNRGCIIQPEGTALDLENKLTWPGYERWKSGNRDYEIYKQLDSNLYRPIGQTDSTKRTFVDDNLADTADQFCYYIRARGFNNEEYARSARVCVKQEAIVYIPNSFSPGITPGVNDAFGPEGLYMENYTMKIYNRWGQRLFETNEGKKWDGTFEGELVPQGVYTYTLVVIGKDGDTEEFNGTVTVTR